MLLWREVGFLPVFLHSYMQVLIYLSSFSLKVVSGTEWGNLLLWEGGLIKVELRQAGHKPCHEGPVSQLVFDEGDLYSVGIDGFIRVSFSFALPLGMQMYGQQVNVTYFLYQRFGGNFGVQFLSENYFLEQRK